MINYLKLVDNIKAVKWSGCSGMASKITRLSNLGYFVGYIRVEDWDVPQLQQPVTTGCFNILLLNFEKS